MGGDLTVESVIREGSVFTAVVPQKIGDRTHFARVENPQEKSVLLYETRKFYAASIGENLSALDVPFKLTDDMAVFMKELENENWRFAFFPSSVSESVKDFIRSSKIKTIPIILATTTDVSISGTDPVLAMPVYALPLANALNGIRPKEAIKEKYSDFTAPEMKILVVDDIVTNLKVMKGLLAPYQCQVDLCSKGAQSVKLLENEQYDIVFMDHMMPEMDGIEATKKIRELPVPYAMSIPIVALTANAISGMRELFLDNGFDDYLAKPIEIPKLNEIMDRWTPKEKRLPVAGGGGGGGKGF
jgi:CheY-like chemotaxis protein